MEGESRTNSFRHSCCPPDRRFGFFLSPVIKGLKSRVSILEQTIKSQNATIKSLEKGFSCLDDINDKYVARLKKVEEHFDVCISDLEHIKDRQLKFRDSEREDLLSQNKLLKSELNKLPPNKLTNSEQISHVTFDKTSSEKPD